MADKKITELPFITDVTASVGVSPSNTTVIPVVLYGTTNQITADNLKDNFIREVRTTVAGVQTYTSSLKGAVTVRGNGIEVAGNLEVGGNVSIKGTLHTQYETASVIYSSGSTKFGNSFDDLHEFTGSLYFTGSHDINGEDYTHYSSSNSAVFTDFSSSNSSAITSFSSSNSAVFTDFSSSNSTYNTTFSSSNAIYITALSSSNSTYNTTFSSSNATYITALSSSNSNYNTNLSSSNSTLFTNFSSSNSTLFTNDSSSASTLFTNYSSSNSTLFTNYSSSNSSYNTTFSSSNSTTFTNYSSSNSTTFTNYSSSNSTTFTNYSSSTANTIAGLSSGVSSELARVYQTTSSLNIFTGSQDSRNFVISQFTSSTNNSIVGVSAFTSSQLAVNLQNSIVTSSYRIELNSIEAYTASLKGQAIVSSSTQVQNYDVFALNSNLYTATGSLIGITNGLMAFTAALDNTYATDAQLFQLYQATRSLELFSGSLIGEIGGIESYTASLKAQTIFSSSNQIFVNGTVISDNTSQKILGTSGNILYLYTGTSGLYINNSANNAQNVTITDAGVVTTRGGLQIGAPGNDQNLTFGGTNSSIYWGAGGPARMYYSVGDIKISSNGATDVVNVQNIGGISVSGGITGSLMATNGVISSSQQITNYYTFALTSSANTFYGNQKIKGNLDIDNKVSITGSLIVSSSTNQLWATPDFELYNGLGNVNFRLTPNTGNQFQIQAYGTKAEITQPNEPLRLLSPQLQFVKYDNTPTVVSVTGSIDVKTGGITGSILATNGVVSGSSQIEELSQIAGIEAYTSSLKNAFTIDSNNDVYFTGKITTQEVHTTYTTSSVLFQSGSTKLGNSSDDKHEITGSLNTSFGGSGGLFVNDGFQKTFTFPTGNLFSIDFGSAEGGGFVDVTYGGVITSIGGRGGATRYAISYKDATNAVATKVHGYGDDIVSASISATKVAIFSIAGDAVQTAKYQVNVSVNAAASDGSGNYDKILYNRL